MTSLPAFPWLYRISGPAREAVSQLGQVETFETGQTVLVKGRPDTHLFVIEEGEVELVDGIRPPQAVGSGELVGETAFLDGAATTTVVARSRTRARRIGRLEMVTALAPQPAALRELLEAITRVHEERSDLCELSDEAFVSELAATALRHRAVRHPYLHALGEGLVPDLRWAMADFARQYYGYSKHFPRYLTTVMSRLENPSHRTALLDNLTEEAGIYGEEEYEILAQMGVQREWIEGLPHPILFRRFADALGVGSDGPEADQVVCWRELFLATLASDSPAAAVGALGLGTENIVRTMYGPFVRALARLQDLSPRDTVFFPLHTAIDDHHQATLEQIAASFAGSPEGRTDLRRGMLKALSCRSAFWDWMYERAMDPSRADDVV
jgi:pyrroloquinoline quinone (PQQ) biosynthesis protein C